MLNKDRPLPMSDAEILREYRLAAEPVKQVRILAELNNTTVERIAHILVAQGVDRRKMPRKKADRKPFALETSEPPKMAEELTAEVVEEPEREEPTEEAKAHAEPKEENHAHIIKSERIEVGATAKGVRFAVAEMIGLLIEKKNALSDLLGEISDELERILAEKNELERVLGSLLRCQEEVEGVHADEG